MENFIVNFWNDFDINLRKGYLYFFILAMTIMPAAQYLSMLYQTCQITLCNYDDLLFFKNLIVLFALYVMSMIVIIIGFVVKFTMVGYTKPYVPVQSVSKNVDSKSDEKSDRIKEYENKIHRLW